MATLTAVTETTAAKSPQGLDQRNREADSTAPERFQWQMLGSVGPAMAVVFVSLVAVFTVPQLAEYRPWTSDDPLPFWNVLSRPFPSEAATAAQAHVAAVDKVADEVLAAPDPPPTPVEPAKPVVEAEVGTKLPPFAAGPDDSADVKTELELPTGHELDRFFTSLARSDASIAGAVTRAVHWGDSAIGVDGIPSAIRRRMQNRFGDAGHGFHLMAPANTSYRHREVDFQHNGKWHGCFIIQKCRSDGHYGLGGMTFRSVGGAQSSFAPHEKRSSGRVSKLDLHYAAQPNGGQIRIRVDEGEKIIVDPEADTLEDRFHSIEVPDGLHELEVRAAGSGRVRVYGVSMERDGPGVVWDGLALVGAFTRRMLEYDATHLAAQLEHRQADLVVFTFGGSDMVRKIKMSTYADEYREVVQHVRKARPEMDCLIMAPLDHGERQGQRIVSRPVVAKMVEAQRSVAKSEGCAFFDTYTAMGGDGSAGRWFRRKPRLMGGDFGHATGKGHQVIGELFFRALVHRYVEFRQARDSDGGIDAAANPTPAQPKE